ncbi:MAG: hypothetical protein IJC10_00170 [Clostridia bacterium]|nr:hypothetical protein [Clostridia bacterium]
MKDIRIYNENLDLVAIIPDFLASNWEIKFSEFGTGEIEFVPSVDTVSLLTHNKHLFLVQGDIQSVVTGYCIGKTCTVFTRTLEWLLTKFVVKEVPKGENLSGTVENILSHLPAEFNLEFYGIDDNCDMSDFTLDKVTDMYSAIKKCINQPDIGFSFCADFKEKKFKFSLKRALENKDIILCDEYKTSYESVYTHDIQKDIQGGYYYHELTCMGKYDAGSNIPSISITPENYGKYYVVSSDGQRMGLNLKKGDILACRDKNGGFEVIDEAKPFLVEVMPEDTGIFSWTGVLDAKNETDAQKEFSDKKPMDMLTLKTRLEYGTDYKIGDIINTRFYSGGCCITKKKLVSGVHMWVERDGVGASPTMTDL